MINKNNKRKIALLLILALIAGCFPSKMVKVESMQNILDNWKITCYDVKTDDKKEPIDDYQTAVNIDIETKDVEKKQLQHVDVPMVHTGEVETSKIETSTIETPAIESAYKVKVSTKENYSFYSEPNVKLNNNEIAVIQEKQGYSFVISDVMQKITLEIYVKSSQTPSSSMPTVSPATESPEVTTSASPTTTPSVPPTPTITPSATPTITPSATPTVTPSATPTVTPSATPTVTPSATPTVTPSATPTVTPSATPTVTPSATPTVTPSATPTVTPSATPTVTPSASPTVTPSATPTVTPSAMPTVAPTVVPTIVPTQNPTIPPQISSAPGVTKIPQQKWNLKKDKILLGAAIKVKTNKKKGIYVPKIVSAEKIKVEYDKSKYTLTYKLSNNKVAKIKKDGTITALKEGKCIITISLCDKNHTGKVLDSKEIIVTVKPSIYIKYLSGKKYIVSGGKKYKKKKGIQITIVGAKKPRYLLYKKSGKKYAVFGNKKWSSVTIPSAKKTWIPLNGGKYQFVVSTSKKGKNCSNVIKWKTK